jgi:tetratricopeptide (TPR) repeat protein
MQSQEEPKIDPKHEKNATAPGLAHATSLKLLPIRVSHLCLRSAYLHRGNALAAMGREDEARESYQKVFPMLDPEPRCGRLDWERSSLYVNIGNTYSRQGKYDLAAEQYKIAEQLGKDHVDTPEGNKTDGMGMMIVAMRAKAFALKKAGKEEEGKAIMKDVIALQLKLNEEKAKEEEEKKKQQEAAAAAEAAGDPAAAGAAQSTSPLVAAS